LLTPYNTLLPLPDIKQLLFAPFVSLSEPFNIVLLVPNAVLPPLVLLVILLKSVFKTPVGLKARLSC